MLIHQHGEPWRNDIDRGKIFDSSNRVVCLAYQDTHLLVNQEELCEGDDEFSPQSIFVYTAVYFIHAVKSYIGPTALLPLKERMLLMFIAFKNP